MYMCIYAHFLAHVNLFKSLAVGPYAILNTKPHLYMEICTHVLHSFADIISGLAICEQLIKRHWHVPFRL